MAHALQDTPVAGTGAVEHFDAMVIGAGVSGLYQLYRLRQLGLAVRCYEEGSGGAAPGIGTATRAAGLIPRVKLTAIRGRRSSYKNGTGRNIFPASRRTSAT